MALETCRLSLCLCAGCGDLPLPLRSAKQTRLSKTTCTRPSHAKPARPSSLLGLAKPSLCHHQERFRRQSFSRLTLHSHQGTAAIVLPDRSPAWSYEGDSGVRQVATSDIEKTKNNPKKQSCNIKTIVPMVSSKPSTEIAFPPVKFTNPGGTTYRAKTLAPNQIRSARN